MLIHISKKCTVLKEAHEIHLLCQTSPTTVRSYRYMYTYLQCIQCPKRGIHVGSRKLRWLIGYVLPHSESNLWPKRNRIQHFSILGYFEKTHSEPEMNLLDGTAESKHFKKQKQKLFQSICLGKGHHNGSQATMWGHYN